MTLLIITGSIPELDNHLTIRSSPIMKVLNPLGGVHWSCVVMETEGLLCKCGNLL